MAHCWGKIKQVVCGCWDTCSSHICVVVCVCVFVWLCGCWDTCSSHICHHILNISLLLAGLQVLQKLLRSQTRHCSAQEQFSDNNWLKGSAGHLNAPSTSLIQFSRALPSSHCTGWYQIRASDWWCFEIWNKKEGMGHIMNDDDDDVDEYDGVGVGGEFISCV